MSVFSKEDVYINYNQYQNIYQQLNDVDRIPYYNKDGLYAVCCDGKFIEYKKELQMYEKEEQENPNRHHYYEMFFIPFGHFKLLKTDDDIVEFVFSNNI